MSDVLLDIIRDEGMRLRPYTDSVGKLTIGVGRNLDDVGITKDEAKALALNDIARAEAELIRNLYWFAPAHENVKRALINMCFNMGWPRLSKFEKMLQAIEEGEYEIAAKEALDSKWASQVGERAQRVAELLRATPPLEVVQPEGGE